MKCPKCGSKTSVFDTRPSEVYGLLLTWRRRACQICGHKFTTYEVTPEILESGEKAKRTLTKIGSLVSSNRE